LSLKGNNCIFFVFTTKMKLALIYEYWWDKRQ